MANTQDVVELANLSIDTLAVFGGIQVVIVGLAIFLGRVWINRIHEKDRKKVKIELDVLRDERGRETAILQAAIQAFSLSHGAAHEKRLDAISDVWNAIVRIRDKTPNALAVSDIMTVAENRNFLTEPKLRAHLDELDNDWLMAGPIKAGDDIEHNRPFVGPILWSIFYAYRAFAIRAAWLFIKSKDSGNLELWFEDNGIEQILTAVLTADEFASFKKLQFGRFQYVSELIQNRFLIEAEHVISGEKTGAFSLEQAQLIAKAASAASGIVNSK